MTVSFTSARHQPVEPLGDDERDLYCAQCGDDTPYEPKFDGYLH